MKFNRVVEELGKKRIVALANIIAQENNLRWNKNIEVILSACCDNPNLAPQLGGKDDDENQAIAINTKKSKGRAIAQFFVFRLGKTNNPDPLLLPIEEKIPE